MNLNIKLDVTKILKEHLFTGKNGAKYLDLTVWENRDGVDSYGNSHMVVQALPKELRDQGQKGPILGNGKTFGQSAAPQQRATSQNGAAPPAQAADDDFDDVPF
jgi:hypothetical protein